jgi:hypothetical protein
MLDRSNTDGDDDRAAKQDRRADGADRAAAGIPKQRLMAESLPDWDLEPPATLLRRPER